MAIARQAGILPAWRSSAGILARAVCAGAGAALVCNVVAHAPRLTH